MQHGPGALGRAHLQACGDPFEYGVTLALRWPPKATRNRKRPSHPTSPSAFLCPGQGEQRRKAEPEHRRGRRLWHNSKIDRAVCAGPGENRAHTLRSELHDLVAAVEGRIESVSPRLAAGAASRMEARLSRATDASEGMRLVGLVLIRNSRQS